MRYWGERCNLNKGNSSRNDNVAIDSEETQMYNDFILSQSHTVSIILILIFWMRRLKSKGLSNLED